MTLVKCYRCGGSALGKTFEDAAAKVNHAVGLSRSIPCGDNYNAVEEIKDTVETKSVETKQSPKTTETKYSKVETKSTEKIVLDESKYSSPKKSKK